MSVRWRFIAAGRLCPCTFVVKFYCKRHRRSDFKYNRLTNRGYVRSILKRKEMEAITSGASGNILAFKSPDLAQLFRAAFFFFLYIIVVLEAEPELGRITEIPT